MTECKHFVVFCWQWIKLNIVLLKHLNNLTNTWHFSIVCSVHAVIVLYTTGPLRIIMVLGR